MNNENYVRSDCVYIVMAVGSKHILAATEVSNARAMRKSQFSISSFYKLKSMYSTGAGRLTVYAYLTRINTSSQFFLSFCKDR